MDPENKGRNRVMSGGPARLRSLKIAEPENKGLQQKPARKQQVAAVLRQKSMNASCSSDASSDSTTSSSRASSSFSSATTGGMLGRSNGTVAVVVKRRQQCRLRIDKDEAGRRRNAAAEESGGDVQLVGEVECASNQSTKRCPWVTPTTEPSYAAFHDEEWGVPVHDDRKLFELLSFSGALAELAWPAILDKRQMFREIFLDFDPMAVSKLNEKKFVMAGSPARSLLSEQKLRSILENARQICKIRAEFGSFDKYIWNFMNQKATTNSFRYSRQVPVKTSKAEVISKDLVRRGFRCIGPTVIYSFMQVAGLTNDHLISCYRHHEYIVAEAKETIADIHILKSKKEAEQPFAE